MISFLRKDCEKLMLAAALLLLAASVTWAFAEHPRVASHRRPARRTARAGSKWHAVAPPVPDGDTARWAEPVAQPDGPGWIYEIFTPPAIYYDPVGKSFSVTSPPNRVDAPALPNPDAFDVELLTVRLEPFRLQLTGYVGTPGNYTGIFVSPANPETILARPGRSFPKLGLRLKELSVVKAPVVHRDPWPVYEVAAIAVLEDEQDGAEVRLDSRTRALTHTPVAVLRLGGGRSELHEGDFLPGDRSAYRIKRIQLDPPEVEVVRLNARRAVPETRVLRPASPDGELARKNIRPDGKLVSVDPVK
jgi:hypothetical protein